MSRWGSVFRIAVAVGLAWWNPYAASAARWWLVASVAESERQRRQRDKANARARAAYNAAQKDRLEMLDLQPDAPRTLVLGRVRYVEGVRRRWTSGTHSEKLTMIVSYAGHEVDAIESWYVDDTPVTRDGSGWVQEAPWKNSDGIPSQNTGTADGSGGAVITLSYTPLAGSWSAAWSNGLSGENFAGADCSVSVVGTTATVSGAQPGTAVAVNYLRAEGTTYLRIRPYLGASGQNIGSAIAAEYPGLITANDKFTDIAAAVVDLIYSPDVFPQGPPNLTAVMRGAKCYDPRLDSTVAGGSGSHRIATPSTWAWTENPALHALRYALWAGGFALAWGRGITAQTLADVIAAANACDVSTVFTLRKPDTTTTTVTLPRFRCGVTISSETDPRQAMDAIVDTMAGEWAFDGPELRLRAGVKATSVASIDQTWLVEAYSPGDEEAEDPVLTSAQSISREQRWNHVAGSCVDPSQRYQLLPYPAVRGSTLITAKGEKRGDLDLPAVNHMALAQHLASIEIRRRQAGTLQVAQTDPRGELLQLFDVVTETLPDYGISAKPFEVVGVEISFGDAPVRLMLREISDALFTVDAELKGVDPAPDSSLRAPWDVGALGALTVTSGTSAIADGSVLTRTSITWAAVTGEWIRNGGDVEIQYTRADQALPTADWASWTEPGTSTQAVIPGLMAGRPYLFRGRVVQRMPLVKGPWTATVQHLVDKVRAQLVAFVLNGTEASRLIVAGNSVERVSGGTAGWNAGFYSVQPITGGCRLTFVVPVAGEDAFIGLNTDPATDAGFSGVDFGWYVGASGQYQVYESGSQKTAGTGYVLGTPLTIEYDGVAVRYWYGNTLERQVAAPPGLQLYVDGSLNTAGAKITGIDFAALAAAQRGNLLDSGSWVSGASGTQGVRGGGLFTEALPAGTNTIALGLAPDGIRRPMWSATSSGTSTYNGWEQASAAADIPVDANKMYRFSVWLTPRVISSTQGSFYFGPKASTVAAVTTGSTVANPYFASASARSALVVDRPYLLVGYVMPSGSGTTQYSQGGIWDGATGEKVASYSDFKWPTGQNVSQMRAFFTGASSGNADSFWDPRIELCDGTEPRIDQLLQVAGSVYTTHLAANAATDVNRHIGGSGGFTANGTGDAVRIGGSSTGGSGAGALLGYTNTSGGTVRVQFEAMLIGLYSATSAHVPDAFWRYQINGGTAVTGGLFGSGGTAPDYTVPRNGLAFGDIELLAGDLLSIELMAVNAATRTSSWSAHALRIAAIKR